MGCDVIERGWLDKMTAKKESKERLHHDEREREKKEAWRVI